MHEKMEIIPGRWEGMWELRSAVLREDGTTNGADEERMVCLVSRKRGHSQMTVSICSLQSEAPE